MFLDWFDGGDAHVKSKSHSIRFAIGDIVTHSKDYIKKAKKGYFGEDALTEFQVARIIDFEHDSGSEYVESTSYAVLRDDKGQIFHRHERWIRKL